MRYSPYDMSPEAIGHRKGLRHTEVHLEHPEFPHRHADRCRDCAAVRDEMDAEPGTLRRRLEEMLADLRDRDQETILDRVTMDDEGTTHYHRLTTTDLAAILTYLPEGS